MKKALPVYTISHFKDFDNNGSFYANTLSRHLKEHHFTLKPHKHDFYLVVLFTHGGGTHEIDFQHYKIIPGAIFMLKPGQTHNWKLSHDIEGFIFFHTQAFYDSKAVSEKIKDYPFFNSNYNLPYIFLKPGAIENISALFSEIKTEARGNEKLKIQKIYNLVTLVYIELTRSYKPTRMLKTKNYHGRLRELEDLLEENFKNIKYAHEYAALMAITEKHLNRVCKSSLDKTTTELISDRVILEAKRLLCHSSMAVGQLAVELGYDDPSYFARLFRKKTGKSPAEFLKENRH